MNVFLDQKALKSSIKGRESINQENLRPNNIKWLIETLEEFDYAILSLVFLKIGGSTICTRYITSAVTCRSKRIIFSPNICQVSEVHWNINISWMKVSKIVLNIRDLENVTLRNRFARFFLIVWAPLIHKIGFLGWTQERTILLH